MLCFADRVQYSIKNIGLRRSMAKPANVIANWPHLIENFQASPQEFYKAFEEAVSRRGVPGGFWMRVTHKEGGLASANREYLRTHRGKYAFDICAAPFGTGFFVSWWFTEPPLRFGLLYLMAFLVCLMILVSVVYSIAFGVGVAASGITLGMFLAGSGVFVGVPLILWFLGNALRPGAIAGESTMLAIPILGWIYERVFAPTTFYSMDTAIMFQKAVHNAVCEVVDCMTANKGIRALSEFERKPIMKHFTTSA